MKPPNYEHSYGGCNPFRYPCEFHCEVWGICYANKINRRFKRCKDRSYRKMIYKVFYNLPKKSLPLPIFLNPMCEIFDTIDPEWRYELARVMGYIRFYAHQKFHILTKCPEGALDFLEWYKPRLPKNLCLGVSVTGDKTVWRIEYLQEIRQRFDIACTCISFEPLMLPVKGGSDLLHLLAGIDLVIIGGFSGKRTFPDERYIHSVTATAQYGGIPVFQKSNCFKDDRPLLQQFPGWWKP